MQEWWNRNWDKALTAFVTTVVAGLIGFFSATITVHGKMGELDTKVAVLSSKLDEAEKGKLLAEQNASGLSVLTSRFDSMNDRVDLAETRVATIKELTELYRQRTVNELEELLRKYGKVQP